MKHTPSSSSHWKGEIFGFFSKIGSIIVLMLCRKFEVILTSIFQVMTILRKYQISEKILVWILVHGFFQKMAPKSRKFLLHFLIHIDVLMLCSKFELIPTSIFRVMAILRKHQKSEKYPVL